MATPFDHLRTALRLSGRVPGAGAGSLAPTLLSSTIDLHPHQIEAAIFALTRPLGRGAILADEVGLGKTIEAGLVISQVLAEGAERVLILVPASLRGQRRAELGRFFGLRPRIVELADLRRKHARFVSKGVVIASITFFANDTNPPELRDADWDLVVIDEAHRLRNVWRTGARRARRLRDLLRSKRKLLLTATPFQNSLLELFGLISFVDEKLLGTEAAFRSRFTGDDRGLEAKNGDELRARLEGVVIRTLRRQVHDTIRFTARRSLLYDFHPNPDERMLYERVSDFLSRSRTLALAFGNRELLLLAYRKILGSSTFALAATLRKLLVTVAERVEGRFAALDLGEELDGLAEEVEELGAPEAAAERLERGDAEGELAELRTYIALAESIRTNAKGERLVGALLELFARARDKGWPEKAVVFTESRRTQEYLERRLREAGFGGRLTLLHGGSGGAEDRDALIAAFRDRTQVLLATEAGAEGLNLQFCNIVVNYDLPWNPQRIEQRIGRCHRYGQPLDVLVVNFLNTTNAADRRLFELLSAKLTLFDGVFGSSDEVLGALESGLDFERRVLSIYQTCRTPEEIDRAFDRLQGEIEAVGSRRADAARALLLDHFDEEVRARLAVRKSSVEEELQGTEAAVRALVLGQAIAAEPEASGDVYRIELPPGVVLRVGAEVLPERVRFTPGREGTVLGPLHPAVRATAAWVIEGQGWPVVHELVVHTGRGFGDRTFTGQADLVPLRGCRGYWLLYRFTMEGPLAAEDWIEVAVLEDGRVLSPHQLAALAAAPRDAAGYAVLAPPAAVRAAAEEALARVLAGRDAERRERAAELVAAERARLERFGAEVLAEGRRHVERARSAWERARRRVAELAADPVASPEARREATSLVDLLEGQLRHEQSLVGEDEERRLREKRLALEELEARLGARPETALAGAARFWVV